MKYSENDVISFVKENDVKFIRLAFVDLFGNLKNLAIMPSELPTALRMGIPLDASAFYGKADCSHSDIFLVPDTSTLSVLPWRPKAGRVVRFFCDLKNPDGSAFEGDMREKLKETAEMFALKGFSCDIGTECQFYLFELDENGEPTHRTNDKASYLDVAPLDHGENIRREICLSIDEMGIHPETSRHLYGNGQNEITFKYSNPVSAADNLLNFKTAVKSIAAQNGLFASFMPYPLRDQPRSALLLNMSICKNDQNIFASTGGKITAEGSSFMAGILNRIAEITTFLNPLTNSYFRNGETPEPKYINWAEQSRDHLIRIVNITQGQEKIELCSPDPSCNLYIALYLILNAGLEGIENKLTLPKSGSKSKKLPSSLKEAVSLTAESTFIKNIFPEFAYSTVLQQLDSDISNYEKAKDKEKFEDDLYFNYI